MARLTTSVNESRIKENLSSKIKLGFPGTAWGGRDSVVNSIVESVGEELVLLRRELANKFEFNQISNLEGSSLEEAGLRLFGVTKNPSSFANTNYLEKNFYFYVEGNTFGEINGDSNIVIPAGTIVGTSIDAEYSSIVYETVEEYVLEAESTIKYCTVKAVNVGSNQNVDSESLVYHNFENYLFSDLKALLCTNRFPILNGGDEESDSIFKSRLNNYISIQSNLNVDRLTLKGLMMPGITEVRVIPSYYGIGSVGVVVFGNGRESNSKLESFFERRLYEFIGPGQDIRVSSGIKIYLDFNIRVYVEKGISTQEKKALVSEIKNNIFNLIKIKENERNISFLEISNLIKKFILDERVLGFGLGDTNNVFEKIFIRRSDRYGFFPEAKEELVSDEVSIKKDERLGFGIVNVILEEKD